MSTDVESQLPFLKEDSHQIDVDLMEQMMAYDRQAKWNFPVGLPECINLKSLAESVIANSGLYSSRKKDRWFKKLMNNPEIAEQWFASLPIPLDQSIKLTTKHKVVLSSLILNGDRINHLKTQLSKHILKGIPEIFLINRYHKKLHGSALFDSIEGLQDGSDEIGREDFTQHAMEMLTFVRCESLHNISSLFLIRVIITNLLSNAYDDVLNDTENASEAASAIFAIGSLAECRWFLDYVYQKSPEAFTRHYSSLSFFNPEKLLARNELSGEKVSVEDIHMPYEPIDLDLTSDQFERLMKLHAEGLRLPLLEMRISELAENMSFDIDRPMAVLDQLDDLLEDTASCEAHIRSVRREIQDIVVHRLPVYMNSHINRLGEAIDRLFAVFDQHEKPDIGAVRQSVDAFCEALPNAKSPKVAGLLAGVMQVDHLVDDAESNVADIIKEHEALSEDIRTLSQDPAKNREQIQQRLFELSEVDAAVDDSLGTINNSLEALSRTLEMAQFRIMEVQEEDESAEKGSEGIDEGAGKHDYEELLEISESENQKLNKELMEAKAQKDNLIQALSTQRDTESSDGMSEAVREIVHKKYIANDKLSVEECLMLTKALYPDTVVLPSAWSSAADYTHFEYTEKLCEFLMKLAGPYRDLIVDGRPDAEARKLFPNKVFAANESETVASGALRKDREFLYNGQPHYFDKHLRLGVASDVRKTIRVHFDVIDNQMVIAFCGEHKRI